MQELYSKWRNWIHVQQTTSKEGVGVVQINSMMPFQTKHCHFEFYSHEGCLKQHNGDNEDNYSFCSQAQIQRNGKESKKVFLLR